MEQLRTKYFWGIFVTVSNWIYIFCCLIIYTSFTVEEEGLYSPRPNPSKAATLLLRLPHIYLGMYYLCTVQYILNTGLVCAVFVYVNSSTSCIMFTIHICIWILNSSKTSPSNHRNLISFSWLDSHQSVFQRLSNQTIKRVHLNTHK